MTGAQGGEDNESDGRRIAELRNCGWQNIRLWRCFKAICEFDSRTFEF